MLPVRSLGGWGLTACGDAPIGTCPDPHSRDDMPLTLRLLLLTIVGRQHRALTLSYALMRAERDY